jgi:hypothetical protein
MLNDLVQQLGNPDPQQRKQAIIALGRLKDPDALKPLAEVYRNDPEETLRDLARKASNYIMSQLLTQEQSSPAATPPAPAAPPARETPPSAPATPPTPPRAPSGSSASPFTLDPEDMPVSPPARAESSSASVRPPASKPDTPPDRDFSNPREYSRLTPSPFFDRSGDTNDTSVGGQSSIETALTPSEKQARFYVEEALGLNLSNDNARAVKSLHKALNLNPRLATDSYFLNVAAAILEVDREAVVSVLHDDSQRQNIMKKSVEQKKTQTVKVHLEEAVKFDANAVTLDLIIYLIISAVGPVLLLLVLAQSIDALVQASAQPDVPTSANVTILQNILALISAPLLFVVAVISVAYAVVSLYALAGLVHLVATRVLGGKSTFNYLLYKMVSLYNPYLIVVFLLSIFAIWISVTTPDATFISGLFGLVIAFGSLFVVFKLAGRIAEAYNFSVGQGCLSIIIAGVMVSIVNSVIWSLIYNVLLNTFARTMGPV